MELAGRRGLFHAPTLRKEIAAAIPALASLRAGDLGEFGVMIGALKPQAVGAGV